MRANQSISRGRSAELSLLTILALVAALLTGWPQPAHAADSISVGPNVNITKSTPYQGEGSIAVNPANAKQLFEASNETANALIGGRSSDGGATWTSGEFAVGKSGDLPSACCDPSLAWDGSGNLFLAYVNGATSSIDVGLSTDGGATWSLATHFDGGVGDVDRPTVAVGDNSVWVTWTQFTSSGTETVDVAGAAVTGAGKVGSWTKPITTGAGDFGGLAVGPDGTVVASFINPHARDNATTSIYTATLGNGLSGGTFGAEVKVRDTGMQPWDPIPAQKARTTSPVPTLAWDSSGGSHNGRLYLVYADSPANDTTNTNVFVVFSDDKGAHWSSPVQVNDDTGTHSHFMPRIAVDQGTGKIAVSWYDTRNSSDNTSAQFFAAISDDGTSFSKNVQVSRGSSNSADFGNQNDYGDFSGLAYGGGVFHPVWADDSNSTGDNPNGAGKGPNMYTAAVTVTTPPPPPPPNKDTKLTYTGATSADYHDAFTASATLTIVGGGPLASAQVQFSLGGGGGSQSCSGTTDGNGNVSCSMTPTQKPGGTTISAAYGGAAGINGSSTSVAFTVQREETALAYTGPPKIANGVPVTLSGTLREDGQVAISGRQVSFVLGTGSSAQSCTGTTAADGSASCSITPNQPLNAAATVPMTASFAGDEYYLPSSATAALRLEYYTGRAFGASADINLLLVQLGLPAQPDTGPIRTAQATDTAPPCSVDISTLVLSASALCARVTTSLAPGTSVGTATVKQATIGLPGLPVIGISGLTATSRTVCGSSTGSSTLTLTIAGVPYTGPIAPNTVIGLPGGATLTLDEQTPVAGADDGTTVNAVHLRVAGGSAADVILGSATSDAHNCT